MAKKIWTNIYQKFLISNSYHLNKKFQGLGLKVSMPETKEDNK